jgi:predicted RNA binding protein YcfA (HicA-like mRNA interferase family)
MKLPRNLSGAELVKGLAKVGYVVTRQKSSHIRLTTQRNGEHHVTVPDHDPLKVGTLSGILADVAEQLGLDKERLLEEMFG